MIKKEKYLRLNDIEAYRASFALSNFIWDKIINWNIFEKRTVGEQFVRSADSISANIAEGFGRYGKKDKICFYRYSFGSLKETLDWNEKSYKRKLLSQNDYEHILRELQNLPLMINSLIKFTNEKLTM